MALCKVCIQEYNDSKRIPVIGKCGHSICLECKNRIKRTIHYDCPFCNMPASFWGAAVNHEVLNIIVKKKQEAEPEKKKEEKVVEDRMAEDRFEEELKTFEVERQTWEEERATMVQREAELKENLKIAKKNSDSAYGIIQNLLKAMDRMEDLNGTSAENSSLSAIQEAEEKIKMLEQKQQRWEEEKKLLLQRAMEAEGKCSHLMKCYNAASGRIETLFQQMDNKDHEIRWRTTTMTRMSKAALRLLRSDTEKEALDLWNKVMNEANAEKEACRRKMEFVGRNGGKHVCEDNASDSD